MENVFAKAMHFVKYLGRDIVKPWKLLLSDVMEEFFSLVSLI